MALFDREFIACPDNKKDQLVYKHPDLNIRKYSRAIVNAHFRIDVPRNQAGIVGLVGGLAEWVFVKPGIVSITISAADPAVRAAFRNQHRLGMGHRPARAIAPQPQDFDRRGRLTLEPVVAPVTGEAAMPRRRLQQPESVTPSPCSRRRCT